MSVIDGNGKGNLLISYIFNSDDFVEQIKEESELKKEISKVLSEKGYKFVIADDKLINEKLISD